MLTIRPFEEEDEELELYWHAGLRHDHRMGWQVQAVTQGLGSGRFRLWPLPIGLLPLLPLGRRFVDGRLADVQVRGEIGDVVIPNVAHGEEITSDRIPPGLYPFGRHRGGVQRLLRYETAQGTCLIPTVELVRFLFLHNKTLAHALMRPGGLMELFCPVETGIHRKLQLDFTTQVPVRALSRHFLKEFAWLAIHPEGYRSWSSVHERSIGQRYVSFRPPPLRNSAWIFRGVRQDGVWLVLELLQVTGKECPARKISYSHPALKRYEDGETDRNASSKSAASESSEGGRPVAKFFTIDAGSIPTRRSWLPCRRRAPSSTRWRSRGSADPAAADPVKAAVPIRGGGEPTQECLGSPDSAGWRPASPSRV